MRETDHIASLSRVVVESCPGQGMITDGDHLGEIYDIMLEKRSGNIAYAVMSFGGFLGIGERYHALPWAALKYDTRQGGYVVGLTIDQLKEAPTYTANELPAGAIVPLTAA